MEELESYLLTYDDIATSVRVFRVAYRQPLDTLQEWILTRQNIKLIDLEALSDADLIRYFRGFIPIILDTKYTDPSNYQMIVILQHAEIFLNSISPETYAPTIQFIEVIIGQLRALEE